MCRGESIDLVEEDLAPLKRKRDDEEEEEANSGWKQWWKQQILHQTNKCVLLGWIWIWIGMAVGNSWTIMWKITWRIKTTTGSIVWNIMTKSMSPFIKTWISQVEEAKRKTKRVRITLPEYMRMGSLAKGWDVHSSWTPKMNRWTYQLYKAPSWRSSKRGTGIGMMGGWTLATWNCSFLRSNATEIPGRTGQCWWSCDRRWSHHMVTRQRELVILYSLQ